MSSEAETKPDLIQREDEHYRRGVVLGLTMAEIVILIIFCLLLLLVTQLRKKETEIAALSAAQKIYAGMQEVAAKSGVTQITPENLPDYFRELILSMDMLSSVQAQNAALIERNTEIEALVAKASEATGQPDKRQALDQLAEMASSIEWAIDRNGGSAIPHAKRAELMKAATEVAAELVAQELADKVNPEQKNDVKPPTPLELLARNQAEGEKLRRENQDLQSQVRSLLDKNLDGGKGTEKPSCWYVKGTTRPEYIFDVSLSNGGITIFEIDLPHRATEKAQLPLQPIRFSTELTPPNFLEATLPLLKWADEHDCRFFVRIYDETGVSDKLTYKQHLKAVEGRFYKFESSDPRSGT